MSFSDKLRAMVSKGVEASRDILERAGAKAKELGELGVLKLEIIQLKSQAQKIAAQLGVEVYSAFVERGEASIGPESPSIKETLKRLDQLEKDIDARELEYKNRGGKEEELEKEAD